MPKYRQSAVPRGGSFARLTGGSASRGYVSRRRASRNPFHAFGTPRRRRGGMRKAQFDQVSRLEWRMWLIGTPVTRSLRLVPGWVKERMTEAARVSTLDSVGVYGMCERGERETERPRGGSVSISPQPPALSYVAMTLQMKGAGKRSNGPLWSSLGGTPK